MSRPRPLATLIIAAALALAPLPAHADTPTPSATAPGPVATPGSTPNPSASGSTPTASSTPAAGVTATATPTPTPVPSATTPKPTTPRTTTRSAAADRSATPVVTLSVISAGGPVAGVFYEDLGRFVLAGTADGVADGDPVSLARRIGSGRWTVVGHATVTDRRFTASGPVQAAGSVAFRASVPGVEGAESVSPVVTVTVRDATLTLDRPSPKVDSLKNLPVRGQLVPARAGVSVHIDVRRGSHWHQVAATPTDAAGRFSTAIGYGKGALASYALRATYHAANTNRWEASVGRSFARIAVLDPRVSATTGADVAKTYRRGCPVGPSKLRTIQLDYYGRDKQIHRGVIIIRTDLTPELTRAFDTALKRRYPIAKMNNPNVYGGNDPRQMAANNTSGFNCRKVVGNPYKMSPHSYGIALDVNTVQNPYRDAHGKWWPKNGKRYIDRNPLRWGMLDKKSALTASLAHDRFFWGGRWNPGRDYQHFEYRR